MAKKYDIVHTEKYEGREGEKVKYTNIGAVIEKDGKFYIKLNVIPVGWNGFASLYEPKPKEGQTQRTKPQQPGLGNMDDFDDDIPF